MRLTRDFPIDDHQGNPTGVVHRAGEIWQVLPGAEEDPAVVWLRQPDGERRTWDDDESIFDYFELVKQSDATE